MLKTALGQSAPASPTHQRLGRVGSVIAGFVAAAALAAPAPTAIAEPTFTVVIDDPDGLFGTHGPDLQSAALAAAQLWGRELDSNATIEILVHPDAGVERGYGRSYVSAFREAVGGLFIVDQGMGFEIRTGVDPNGAAPDVEIAFNPGYVDAQFWYDPDPSTRSAPVPNNRLDAISVMLHELGHALVYNGFVNDFDGSYPDPFRSTFDRLTEFDGENFSFVGQQCVAVYGGPVPLTHGLTDHWGNFAPGPGSELINELMNGLVFQFGRRYAISDLDRAAIVDCGLPLRASCPVDVNGDGVVDPDDLSDYIACFFSTPPCDQADFSGDGFTDPDDLSDYISAFFGGGC